MALPTWYRYNPFSRWAGYDQKREDPPPNSQPTATYQPFYSSTLQLPPNALNSPSPPTCYHYHRAKTTSAFSDRDTRFLLVRPKTMQ